MSFMLYSLCDSCLSMPPLTKWPEVTDFDFAWAQLSSWLIFQKVSEGRHYRFQFPPHTRWPSSTPFSLHHWPRRAQQMAIAVLLTPVKAGPGSPLSLREGERGGAQGWCWISHPTASGLARPGADGQAGGGGGWKVGAVYWCLSSLVCLCTFQSYCPCSQLWSTTTVSTSMNMPLNVFPLIITSSLKATHGHILDAGFGLIGSCWFMEQTYDPNIRHKSKVHLKAFMWVLCSISLWLGSCSRQISLQVLHIVEWNPLISQRTDFSAQTSDLKTIAINKSCILVEAESWGEDVTLLNEAFYGHTVTHFL